MIIFGISAFMNIALPVENKIEDFADLDIDS